MSDKPIKLNRVGKTDVVFPHTASFTLLSPDAGSKPTDPRHSNEDTSGEYQPWGSNNLWPTEARQKLEASTTAYPFVAMMVGMWFGRGLTYYKEMRTEEGLKFEYPTEPKIDEFLANNDINYFMLERMMDYKSLGNIWCEFILSKNKQRITNVYHKEAEFTRFGKIDEKTHQIKNIQYSAAWDGTPNAVNIDFLNRQDRNREYIQKTFSSKKFSIHSCLPSPGRTLYAMPPHGAIFKKDGWLDYTNSVPELMNKINKTAKAIKYHIQIPYSYWQSTHKDWNMLDQDARDKVIDAKLSEMKSFLEDNDEVAFISHYATDDITGKKTSGWEITTLDDNFKKDKFLTSVQEGDVQVARALGVDTSMAGIQSQGGKMGAGSGSDKRVGFTNMLSMSHSDLWVVTEPLRFIQWYNEWDPEIKWGFLHDLPTTLNEDKSGTNENTLDT